jgi:parallel beta-helix repeat protein
MKLLLQIIPAVVMLSSTAAAQTPLDDASCPSGSTIITSGDIQTAWDGVPFGGTLCLNGGTYLPAASITLAKSGRITAVGGATIRQAFSSGFVFEVNSGGVTIDGLIIHGANRTTTDNACNGTGGIHASNVDSVNFSNNILSRFVCGILLEGVANASVRGNIISKIAYVGIGANDSAEGVIDGNRIRDIAEDQALGWNAYGVVFGGNTTVGMIASNNRVVNAPTWECYDVHIRSDDTSASFINNYCLKPGRVGINAAISSGNPTSTIVIERNMIDGGGLGTQWNSIVNEGTQGTLRGNIVQHFPVAGQCYFFPPKIAPRTNICR